MSSSHTKSRLKGGLFIVSAPSGAGKTSLCNRLVDFFPHLRHSVSFTTRAQRAGEEDGVDYFFIAPEAFAEMVEQGAFAEWAEVHGNRYGTAIETLEHWREQGFDVLLDIDIQGAAQLRKAYGEGVFIFILPPDLKELRKRLENRQTDDAEVIERRMKNARDEIHESVNYDFVVVNDDFDVALDALKSIIVAEGCRTARVLPGLTEVFDLDI